MDNPERCPQSAGDLARCILNAGHPGECAHTPLDSSGVICLEHGQGIHAAARHEVQASGASVYQPPPLRRCPHVFLPGSQQCTGENGHAADHTRPPLIARRRQPLAATTAAATLHGHDHMDMVRRCQHVIREGQGLEQCGGFLNHDGDHTRPAAYQTSGLDVAPGPLEAELPARPKRWDEVAAAELHECEQAAARGQVHRCQYVIPANQEGDGQPAEQCAGFRDHEISGGHSRPTWDQRRWDESVRDGLDPDGLRPAVGGVLRTPGSPDPRDLRDETVRLVVAEVFAQRLTAPTTESWDTGGQLRQALDLRDDKCPAEMAMHVLDHPEVWGPNPEDIPAREVARDLLVTAGALVRALEDVLKLCQVKT